MLQEDACGAHRVPTGMPAWLPTISPVSAEWLGDETGDETGAGSTRVPVQDNGGDACDCHQAHDDYEAAVSGLGKAALADKRAEDPDTSSNCHSLDSTLVAKTGISVLNAASPKPAAVHSSHQHGRHMVLAQVGRSERKDVVGGASADASPILQGRPTKLEPLCDMAKDRSVGDLGKCAGQASEQEGLSSICDILTFGIELEAAGPASDGEPWAHGLQRVSSAYDDVDMCELLTFGGEHKLHNVAVIAGHDS